MRGGSNSNDNSSNSSRLLDKATRGRALLIHFVDNMIFEFLPRTSSPKEGMLLELLLWYRMIDIDIMKGRWLDRKGRVVGR